jgi:hypothetical protein
METVVNAVAMLFLFFFALVCFGCVSTTGGSACHSPGNYIKEVYSSGNNTIEYSLDSAIQYKNMSIIFFAKRGKTLRNNTIVKLDSPSGSIRIPDSVFVPPAQRWFNFYVTDQSGCSMWGLVNEMAIQRQGNVIDIDEPTPGEGHAFVVK